MKKNFLMVASLLIAAMLLVVSCSQEVKAPENNGLVEATLGLAYGKDVTVEEADGKVITYTYQLRPLWSGVDNSTEIYGNQNETPVKNGEKYGVSENVSSVSMGKVTPGLWEITVRGYTGYNTEDKVLVLKGVNNAYFVNGSNHATVIVSPTNSTGVGTVKISLEMQDLGDNDKNAIDFIIYNVTEGKEFKTDVKLDRVTSNDETNESGDVTEKDKNVYAYKATLNNVPAGYNTIKFKTPSVAGDGGIIKTFLVIPGNTVTITGSVSPSEFQTGEAKITTVSMKGAELSVTDVNKADVEKDTNGMYTLTASTNYSIKVNDDTIKAAFTNSLPSGFASVKPVYEWYVNGEKASGSSDTFTFNEQKAGDYTVTCTFKYSFTNGTDIYTWIGDASLGKIRVPASN
ncbi:MAG: hypothetical protein PUD65_00050 [Spirochaetales bacterium]|nr:hypothetical protein [Spirochaetales bacterium]